MADNQTAKIRIPQKSIDDWAEKSWSIFGDEQIHLHPSQVFLLLSEAGGIIAEDTRRGKYHKALSDLALCFCSSINMYNRIANDPAYIGIFDRDDFKGVDNIFFINFLEGAPIVVESIVFAG